MKTNGTIIGEGKINNIPKSTNISMRLLPLNYTSSKYKNILHKYYVSRNENNSINVSCKIVFEIYREKEFIYILLKKFHYFYFYSSYCINKFYI